MRTATGNFAEINPYRTQVTVSRGGVGDLCVVVEVERIEGEVFIWPSFERGGISDNQMSLEEYKQALVMLQEATDVARVAWPKIFRTAREDSRPT